MKRIRLVTINGCKHKQANKYVQFRSAYGGSLRLNPIAVNKSQMFGEGGNFRILNYK